MSGFDKIIGQDRIKESLLINIGACQIENKALPHILFCGVAGSGKTLFATSIADNLNVQCQVLNGSSLDKIKDILPFLARIKEKSILFIDEVHACSVKVFDYLLTVMTDYKMTVGDVTYEIPKFTLIGATTNSGELIKPLRDRFILKYNLQPYSTSDIHKIIQLYISQTYFSIAQEARELLVSSSRLNPRVIKNRLEFVKNYKIACGGGFISFQNVIKCLELEDVSMDGTDANDRLYLKVLQKCQPAGINTLVATTGLSKDNIENIIEPFLLSVGKIFKSPRGRRLV